MPFNNSFSIQTLKSTRPYIEGVSKGSTTFRITILSIKTLSMKGLFGTLSIMTFSINDTQHNSTLNVIMLNVAFYLLLC